MRIELKSAQVMRTEQAHYDDVQFPATGFSAIVAQRRLRWRLPTHQVKRGHDPSSNKVKLHFQSKMSNQAGASDHTILLEEPGAKGKGMGKKALAGASSLVNDFKAFVMRGNVVDLAIAVIMGAAFSAVVTSFVTDIVTPFIALAAGGSSLPDSFVVLRTGANFTTVYGGNYGSLTRAKADGAITWNWGNFLNNIIYFLIVSAIMFFLFKAVSLLYTKPAATAPCSDCLEDVKIGAKVCPHCRKNLIGSSDVDVKE
ncbi:hypothetical protein HDU93_008508 [Gonapodya sp. JEL0774]|nr:hypothetical protein HDU93_008508 [Gonapodya sp. JEL0774]